MLISCAVGIVFSVQPALSTELWDCYYVHNSFDSGPNSPGPLNIHAQYQIDAAEIRLLNGTARYQIATDTDFGVTAVRGDKCSICTGGPLIDAEVVAINRFNGHASMTTIFVAKNTENGVSVDKGHCSKVN
jgi:hypothetical protein